MTAYVFTSGGFPASPVAGDTLAINSAQYDWNGTTWQARAAGGNFSTLTTNSATAPTSPLVGDRWFNTTTGVLVQYFSDGTDSAWLDIAKVSGSSGAVGAAATGGVTSYADLAALIAVTPSTGDMALVQDISKMFVYTGTGWFLIATVTNGTPSAISGVAGSYDLDSGGTPTVITAVSTDPEGFPLTWSYSVTTGSLGSTATVTQADNVFTITPSTDAANAGTFGITFSATDGATGLVTSASTFTLTFVQGFLDFSLPAATTTMANYSYLVAWNIHGAGNPSWVFNGTHLVMQQNGAYDCGFYRPFSCVNGTTYTFTLDVATFPSSKRTIFIIYGSNNGLPEDGATGVDIAGEITAAGTSSRTWTANFTGTAYIMWRTVTTNSVGTYHINSLNISPWD